MPDFLGIGAPRSGTTWLYYNLDEHPEICMPVRKEQVFWDNNLSRGIKSYSRAFVCAPEQKAGEITPRYGIMDRWRVRLMARALPAVRLIYILRNPIERSWSHLSLDAHHQGRTVEEMSADEIKALLTSPRYDRNASYQETYRIYTEVFPREQVFVGFYDDIAQQPKELLTGIFEHIGVTTEIDWASLPMARRFNSGVGLETQNHSTSTSMPDEIRRLLAKRYSKELRFSAMTFRGHAETWAAEARDILA